MCSSLLTWTIGPCQLSATHARGAPETPGFPTRRCLSSKVRSRRQLLARHVSSPSSFFFGGRVSDVYCFTVDIRTIESWRRVWLLEANTKTQGADETLTGYRPCCHRTYLSVHLLLLHHLNWPIFSPQLESHPAARSHIHQLILMKHDYTINGPAIYCFAISTVESSTENHAPSNRSCTNRQQYV